MIREEAKEDEEYVREYCKERNIAFEAKEINVEEIAKNNKIGTEEAGRETRYSFFKEIMEKYEGTKIATAHTKSDNAETVLMNMIRGTGISGLKGIKALRDTVYIKPLINASRSEIEAYTAGKNLNPRHDRTNDENIYTRNKVRNILIPLIKEEFNPNIVDTLDRLSKIVTLDNEYLEEETQKAFSNIVINEEKEEIILNLNEFNKRHIAIKSRLIMLCIKKLLGNTNGIGKVHIDDIITLAGNNIGNKYLTPNKHIKIAVGKGKMSFFVTKKT